MVRRALLLLTLFAPLVALAQSPVATQEVVNGNLQLPPGTPAANTVVRFQLVYCGGNTGRVTNPDGSVTIVSFVPWELRTSNGTWSTNLYGSDVIQCGTEMGTSRWRITPIFNGVNGPAYDYQINSCGGFSPPKPNGCFFDVDSAPQCGNAGATTNCVVQYPYVVPPPEPIQGPPGPAGPAGAPGPPGPAGPAGSNPGTAPQIAYYAGSAGATVNTVTGNPRFFESGSSPNITLNYTSNGYTQGTYTVDNALYLQGAWYMDTPMPTSAMNAAPAARSGMGVNTDGNFYISANAGTPSEICTAANGACAASVSGNVLYPAHLAVYPVLGQAGPLVIGLSNGNAPYQAGTSTNDVTPTPTTPLGRHFVSSATASTTNAIGMVVGQSGSNSVNVPYVSFTRFSTRLSLFALGNCRFYFGLSTYNAAGLGGNTLSVLGTAKFATDTPNTGFIGFRYSNGTDTTFKAVTINPGGSVGSATVQDTGVTADTNVHLFEIYPTNNNTVMTFYIDKVLVQTISTNLPPVAPSSVPDGFGSPFFTGDNKNTATLVGLNFYSMEVSLKLP